MRRVQGRPQSPWKMEQEMFAPYDKPIPLKEILSELQGGFAVAPLTPSQSPFFEGHCSETFKFLYKSTSSGTTARRSPEGDRKALWNKRIKARLLAVHAKGPGATAKPLE
jgi:hypothetical protein